MELIWHAMNLSVSINFLPFLKPKLSHTCTDDPESEDDEGIDITADNDQHCHGCVQRQIMHTLVKRRERHVDDMMSQLRPAFTHLTDYLSKIEQLLRSFL